MFDKLQPAVLLYVLDHEVEILSRMAEMSDPLLFVELRNTKDLIFQIRERLEVLGMKSDDEYEPRDRMVLPYVIVKLEACKKRITLRSRGFVCGRKHFAVIE